MMKKYMFIMALLGAMTHFPSKVSAQECETPMGVALVSQVTPLPATAESHLLNRMRHLASANGIAGSQNTPFYMCAKVDVVGKHIVPGAPPQHAYELSLSFYIVDNEDQKIYSSTLLEVKGVGSNENKAIMDGIRRINANNPELKRFLSEGKKKVQHYYDTNYRGILVKADAMSKMKQYEGALGMLLAVPSCSKGYEEALAQAQTIFQSYINEQCNRNLAAARSAWLANPNPQGAAEAGEYLSQIHPEAACYEEALELHKEIAAKNKEDYKFEMKKYSDQISLGEKYINMMKEVGVAYGKGPKESDKEPLKIYWIK